MTISTRFSHVSSARELQSPKYSRLFSLSIKVAERGSRVGPGLGVQAATREPHSTSHTNPLIHWSLVTAWDAAAAYWLWSYNRARPARLAAG